MSKAPQKAPTKTQILANVSHDLRTPLTVLSGYLEAMEDGILDAKDKCPSDPEDKDGFEDENGCPDYDNDKDGVPDTLDNCMMEPETFNGYKDKDGCPDDALILRDSDQDGISDTLDDCPLQPETYRPNLP